MTSAAAVSEVERSDAGTLVIGGLKLGVITTVGVVIFALASRSMGGIAETVVQSILIIAGGLVFSIMPALTVRCRSIDGVGWAMLMGLLGALFFTVFDVIALRPLDIYHWTWDEIGGGSGFWYIPIWWMGAAVLAALGGMIVVGDPERPLRLTAARVVGFGLVAFGFIAVSGVLPANSAVMALAISLGLAADAAATMILKKG